MRIIRPATKSSELLLKFSPCNRIPMMSSN